MDASIVLFSSKRPMPNWPFISSRTVLFRKWTFLISGPERDDERRQAAPLLQDGVQHGHPAAAQHQVLRGGALLQHGPAASGDTEDDGFGRQQKGTRAFFWGVSSSFVESLFYGCGCWWFFLTHHFSLFLYFSLSLFDPFISMMFRSLKPVQHRRPFRKTGKITFWNSFLPFAFLHSLC